MSLADIQAAFGQPPTAQPAAPAAPAPLPPCPAGHKLIQTPFGIVPLADTIPLPQSCQYIDPATGKPYPPLNPPGESGGMQPTPQPQPQSTPQPQPQTVNTPVAASAPSPFAPTPQAAPPAASQPAPTAAAPTPSVAPPVVQPTTDTPPTPTTIVMPDSAPKARGRGRSAPTGSTAPGATAPGLSTASPASGGDMADISTEDLRDELTRRGWTVALGGGQ